MKAVRLWRSPGLRVSLVMARSMPKDIRFPVPVEVEKRITERDDPVVLASWLSRATTVSEVAELWAG